MMACWVAFKLEAGNRSVKLLMSLFPDSIKKHIAFGKKHGGSFPHVICFWKENLGGVFHILGSHPQHTEKGELLGCTLEWLVDIDILSREKKGKGKLEE